jgi:hypothetical protein
MTPGLKKRGKKAKTSAPRGRLSLDHRGPHKVSAQSGEYSDLTRWCYRTEFPNPLKRATSILYELQEMSLPLQ